MEAHWSYLLVSMEYTSFTDARTHSSCLRTDAQLAGFTELLMVGCRPDCISTGGSRLIGIHLVVADLLNFGNQDQQNFFNFVVIKLWSMEYFAGALAALLAEGAHEYLPACGPLAQPVVKNDADLGRIPEMGALRAGEPAIRRLLENLPPFPPLLLRQLVSYAIVEVELPRVSMLLLQLLLLNFIEQFNPGIS